MSEILMLDPHAGSSFDLEELLAIIGVGGEKLFWRTVPPYESTEFFFRAESPREDWSELQARFDAEENGAPISWAELVDIGADIFQTSWMMLLAFDSPEPRDLSPFFSDKTWYLDRTTPAFFENVPLAIQANDATYWFVHARDPDLRERFRRSFPAWTPRR